MTNDYHGIIYAYETSPGLGALVSRRTSASMPVAGRFRAIDFALSSFVNAGLRDVGVVMQRDYQSLLDHLGSGKDWDMSRRSGGLNLLPPFGLPDSHFGEYKGSMEALTAMRSYIEGIKKDGFILCRGDVVASINMTTALSAHERSGKRLTAICSKTPPREKHHRFIPESEDSRVSRELRCSCVDGDDNGYASLEAYIIEKELLLEMISRCAMGAYLHFHRDALTWYLQDGGSVNLCIREGYSRQITTVKDYYNMSMDILRGDIREQLFPADRPVRTKERAEVSTYYGDKARAKNCLMADGCYIEGELENCVLFRGVRVGRGAKLKNCIILQDSVIEDDVNISYAVVDKDATITSGTHMAGSPNLPLVVPKGSIV